MGTRLLAISDLAVVMTANNPLPKLAPNTKPKATSIGTPPEAAIVAVSKTIARLE